MPWKDFFYFSRSERNGIVVMLLLIILVLFAPLVYQWVRPRPDVDFSAFEKAVQDFEQKLEAMQLEADAQRAARFSSRQDERQRGSQTVEINPVPFNPNNLTQEAWEAMGVPSHIARTIKNYEAAGGSFRFKEDLRRIYLMEDEIYHALEPYMELPSRAEQGLAFEERPVSRTLRDAGEKKDPGPVSERTFEPTMVDINLADTLELTKLRGIGPVFSRRIFNYREQLGGFNYPGQLLEVFGMDSARFEQILPYITFDSLAIRKIDLNRAEFADLVRHPYIDRNLAGGLIAFRNQHGPFKEVEEIKNSFLVNDTVFQKIAPYLAVEHP